MLIAITGSRGKQKQTLDSATRFFAKQLLHGRTVQNLEIDIEILDDLDVEGECISEDDRKNPRYFTINLRRQPIDEMIRVLAHEMVHVKQYAKNELSKQLRVARGGKVKLGSKWLGQFWDPKRNEDNYWDSPWEIEAYGREVGLHHKWVYYYKK